MKHVLFLSALLIISLGLVILTRALQIHHQTRSRLSKRFVLFYVVLQYHLTLSTLLAYFSFNDVTMAQSPPWQFLSRLFFLQTPLVLALFAFLLISLILELRQRPWNRRWLWLFWGLQLIPMTLRLGFSYHLEAIVLALLFTYGSVLILAGWSWARPIPSWTPRQGRMYRLIILTVLICTGLTLIMTLASVLGMFTEPLDNFLSLVPPLLVIIPSLLYQPLFVTAMTKKDGGTQAPDDWFLARVKEYSISRREQEIVRLICQGRTNKEIEDELFISMATVKDHISNIFRKTGVSNRVQLAALFHFKGE